MVDVTIAFVVTDPRKSGLDLIIVRSTLSVHIILDMHGVFHARTHACDVGFTALAVLHKKYESLGLGKERGCASFGSYSTST